MLISVKPQYITNEKGEKISVILPINEYERILNKLEDIEDVRLFDEAKKGSSPSLTFYEYVKQRQSK